MMRSLVMGRDYNGETAKGKRVLRWLAAKIPRLPGRGGKLFR